MRSVQFLFCLHCRTKLGHGIQKEEAADVYDGRRTKSMQEAE